MWWFRSIRSYFIICEMMKGNQGLKASIAFFFSSVITSGIAYIVTPIYTRLLSPEIYGQSTVFLTWQSIFGIVAMFSLSAGVFNNGMVDYPDDRQNYMSSMLALSNIVTVIFTVIMVIVHPLLKDIIDIEMPLLLLMCCVFLFQPAYNFWCSRQRYELKYKSTVIWAMVCAIASPVCAIISIINSDNKLYARLFGAEITLIIIYIGFYFYVWIKAKGQIKIKYWMDALKFNLPLIPHYLSAYLLGNSNKILISNIVNNASAAYYSVALSVANVASIMWNAINSTLVPFTYENCKNKNYKAISRIATYVLGGFAILCVTVMLLAPEIVMIMSNAEYMEAVYIIPWSIGGVFFQVQYYLYANVIYFYKRPRYVMYASVSTVILNLILGYFAISKFGYLVAGCITLICYLVQAILDYLAMKKVVKEPIYNMKLIGILSLIVVLFAIVCDILYRIWILRYALILIIIISVIICRKKIFCIIKQVR